MVKLLLGLDTAPSPHDAADALAIAICHINSMAPAHAAGALQHPRPKTPTSWRQYRPART
jgi:hypothetical protein